MKITTGENRQAPSGRHELKHYINAADYAQLRARLRALTKPDANAGGDGTYKVRSLYFDNYSDKAVMEKLSGLGRREKFRLRYYNGDTSFIRLEKKSKANRLSYKEGAGITAGQCGELLAGRYDCLKARGGLCITGSGTEGGDGLPQSHDGAVAGISGGIASGEAALLMELYTKIHCQSLRPKNIVDYTREAYTYRAGNVRVTFDSDIRTSNAVAGFLDPSLATVPAAGAMIMEIKYDGFLPDVIRDILQIGWRNQTEFSKYIVARMV